MPNEVLIKYGTQLLFADHATDFGAAPATAANSLIIGTPTDVQMDLGAVAASGGSHQSAKTGDLGSTRAYRYVVDACLEFATAPADAGLVHFFWAPSPSATAGTGNVGGTSGSDASYTETNGSLGQLQFIGSMTVRNTTINIGRVGVFSPLHRYGALVIENDASTAIATTADEVHITVTPIVDEIQ